MQKFFKLLKRTSKQLLKLNTWTKMALFMGSILIILIIANFHTIKIESFTHKQKFITKENDNIYDDFYCSLYDELVYDHAKNKYEVNEIKYQIKPAKSTRVLDIGSGCGHHVDLLNKNGYTAEGVDKSKAMVKYAKKKYTKYNFRHGDAT